MDRVTPRNSDMAVAPSAQDTPFANLRQLAGLIQKSSEPRVQPSMAPSSSTNGAGVPQRTPMAGRSMGGRSARRPVTLRRGPPTTPHALRALQQRRAAALTPGHHVRRQSGRQQRETPRETLRQLSKLLAKDSVPPPETPVQEEQQQQQQPQTKTTPSFHDFEETEEDLEQEPDLPIPRLSLPLEIEDEDESNLQDPPDDISEHLEDENITQRSVEMARRAYTELPTARQTRASFGSIRFSDRFVDVNELKDQTFMTEGGDISVEEADGEDDVDPDVDMEEADEDLILHDETTQNIPMDFSDDNENSHHDDEMDDVDDDSGIPIRPQEDDDPEMADPTTTTSILLNDSGNTTNQQHEHNNPLNTDEYDSDDAEGTTYSYSDTTTTTTTGTYNENTTDPLIRPAPPRLKPSNPNRILKTSRYGIPYPSLPAGMVKRIATTLTASSPHRRGGGGGVGGGGGGSSNKTISKDTLKALIEASDCFFEQLGDDLGGYAREAGREKIEERDVITLMKRQRQIKASATPFSLAQRYLPRELLQDLRMDYNTSSSTANNRLKRFQQRRRRELETIREEDEDAEDEEGEEEDEGMEV
ncbi:MAG: hypothetical protein M1823_002819 [Watsoniomyces obsoletus]|nr:MAG: hypothetical protein M1823_002819 [Watsoniomyces obsoletus]